MLKRIFESSQFMKQSWSLIKMFQYRLKHVDEKNGYLEESKIYSRAQVWAPRWRTAKSETYPRQYRLKEKLPVHSSEHQKHFYTISNVPGHRNSVLNKNFCLKNVFTRRNINLRLCQQHCKNKNMEC